MDEDPDGAAHLLVDLLRRGRSRVAGEGPVVQVSAQKGQELAGSEHRLGDLEQPLLHLVAQVGGDSLLDRPALLRSGKPRAAREHAEPRRRAPATRRRPTARAPRPGSAGRWRADPARDRSRSRRRRVAASPPRNSPAGSPRTGRAWCRRVRRAWPGNRPSAPQRRRRSWRRSPSPGKARAPRRGSPAAAPTRDPRGRRTSMRRQG